MLYSFSAQPSKRSHVQALFLALTFGVALTALPTASHAQLQAHSVARTQNPPSADDSRNGPVGTPMVETRATAHEFGAVAQSAMNVFAGDNSGSLGGNSHACAGSQGQLPSGSLAEASTQGSFGASLLLTSSTLPVGTLVDVQFRYMGSVSAHLIKDVDFDDVTISANVSISAQAAGQSVNGKGSYSYQSVRGGGIPETKTGIFGSESMVTGILTGVPVGSQISFTGTLEMGVSANAVLFAYNSGDIKAGVVWGAQLSNPNARLVYGPSNTFFPSLSNVSDTSLANAIPPFQLPVDTSAPAAAPEPGTLPLLGMGLVSGMGTLSIARRRKQVTAAKQGLLHDFTQA